MEALKVGVGHIGYSIKRSSEVRDMEQWGVILWKSLLLN